MRDQLHTPTDARPSMPPFRASLAFDAVQRLSFRIPAEAREDVLDGVLPALPGGIVEKPVGDGMVEISAFGAALPPEPVLHELAGRPIDALDYQEVPADWRDRRRRFGGGAVLISDRLVVRSPDDPPSPPGVLEVVIDRGGSGFGSGSHPTTQMCLGLLLDLDPQGGGASDFGCGVGTLAIAAAKLGWAPVCGIDREAPAIEEARANARRNEVDVAFAHGDVATDALPIRELLLGNAPPPVHERLAAEVTPQVRHVIVSGIVEGEMEKVRAAYERTGLKPLRGMAADTWIAMLLGRDP
jgi:ribosomal protein L11 methyltransferase